MAAARVTNATSYREAGSGDELAPLRRAVSHSALPGVTKASGMTTQAMAAPMAAAAAWNPADCVSRLHRGEKITPPRLAPL